jgi:hypothetical protein
MPASGLPLDGKGPPFDISPVGMYHYRGLVKEACTLSPNAGRSILKRILTR